MSKKISSENGFYVKIPEKKAIDTIIIANMLDTKVDVEKLLKKKQRKKHHLI